MPMLEEKARVVDRGILPQAGYQQKQRRQMYLALGLLLTALVVVVVKDRAFWMGTPPTAEVAPDDTAARQTSTGPGDTSTSEPAPSQSVPQSGTSTSSPTKAKSRVDSHPAHAVHEVVASPAVTSLPTITASNRAALPPLEIEVVAG